MSKVNLFCWSPLALALAVSTSLAQPLELNPNGDGNVTPPKEPDRQPIIVNVPGAQGQQGDAAANGEAAEDESGFYYNDDLDQDLVRPTLGGGVRGPVPETHVVQSGDTLWDICGFYFNNPWEWPRIWSYNPSITNPHWIYPGDLVRLYEGNVGMMGTQPQTSNGPEDGGDGGDEEPIATTGPVRKRGFSLRRLAFVDAKDLQDALIVDGSVEERLLLSRGDDVYLRYNNKNKPKRGDQFTVYQEVEKVVHPKTGKVVGAFVRTRGDVEVKSVKQDRRARALITRSSEPIERGNKVGPIRKAYGQVQPRRNEKGLQGTIVGVIDKRELIGARQLVLIDLGKNVSLKEGNRLFVVRRGDARTDYGNQQTTGQDDRRFPARAIGEVIVVDVGEQISLALVTLSMQELGVGDRVLMRKDAE